jgi:ankyrin repeat protein
MNKKPAKGFILTKEYSNEEKTIAQIKQRATFKLLQTINKGFNEASRDDSDVEFVSIDEKHVLDCIRKKADLNRWDIKNQQPLLHTLVYGMVFDGYNPVNTVKITQFFLENGADVLAVNGKGDNFFHVLTSVVDEETLSLFRFIKTDDINRGLRAKNNEGLQPWEIYASFVDSFEDIHYLHQLMPKVHFEEHQLNRLEQIFKHIRTRSAYQTSQNGFTPKELGTYPENIRLFVYALGENLPQIVQAYQNAINIHQPFAGATLLQRAAQNGDHELTMALLNLDEKKTGKKMLHNLPYADLSISFFAAKSPEDESVNALATQVARIEI